jgi:hypothetical protein
MKLSQLDTGEAVQTPLLRDLVMVKRALSGCFYSSLILLAHHARCALIATTSRVFSILPGFQQGLWHFPIAPSKTGTGNHDVRSKRTPTISVLMGKDEDRISLQYTTSAYPKRELKRDVYV